MKTPESLDQLLALDHEDFVNGAYRLLLRRAPDEGGASYYLSRLQRGFPKGEVIWQICQSREWRAARREIPGLRGFLESYRQQRRSIRSRLAMWLGQYRFRNAAPSIAAVESLRNLVLRLHQQQTSSIEALSIRLDRVNQANGGSYQTIRREISELGARLEALKRQLENHQDGIEQLNSELIATLGADLSDDALAGTDSAEPPLFSIVVPTYKTPVRLAREMIESVRAQSDQDWELCICDDGSNDAQLAAELLRWQQQDRRIRAVIRPDNRGISAATNSAVELARGRFLVFVDHDDLLKSDALEAVRAAALANPSADVFYSDQDKIDEDGNLIDTFHKPGWSPDYLRRVMYVGHLLVAEADLVRAVGGLRSEFDKVQDFELTLRLSERARGIVHIPRVLYSWRAIHGSIATAQTAKGSIEDLQARAVNEHLSRLAIPARASPHPEFPHRLSVSYSLPPELPLVSIVIPSRDQPQHIGRCLRSIYEASTYPNIEVIVVDNQTTDPEALAVMKRYPVRRIEFNQKFNYSKANNIGVAHATGEFVILLNNDTEVVANDWIERLVGPFSQADVAMTGALLVYPNDAVQHAGVVLGPRGTADHLMRNFPATSDGYAGSLSCSREVSAVTAACLMVRREVYLEVDGLNELYGTHYQDVDFCLKVSSHGRILFVPEAKLVHHESATRGTEYDILDRLLLQDRWHSELADGDRYFNPAFSMQRLDYSLKQAHE